MNVGVRVLVGVRVGLGVKVGVAVGSGTHVPVALSVTTCVDVLYWRVMVALPANVPITALCPALTVSVPVVVCAVSGSKTE